MDIQLQRHPETGELIKEEWREVPEYDGYYEVSNYGRFRSWHNAGYGKKSYPKIMSLVLAKGYQSVQLCLHGSRIRKKIHRLVGRCFIPNPEGKKNINHLDGNKLNNFYLNLEWCTNAENINHAINTGLIKCKGEDSPCSLLNKKDIINIRKLYKTGNYYQEELSEMFGIGQSHISRIIRKEAWSHI